jgi:predicted ATPase/DNA-binding SARP family transcriptional activator
VSDAETERPDKDESVSDTPLHLVLLGTLSLAWGEEALLLPRTAAARSLLAYIVLHHGHVLPRDPLAGTFWPDRPDAEARKALSDALWQIRQCLGPAAGRLTVERDTVSLTLMPHDNLDVEEFTVRLRRYRERHTGTSPPPAAALSTCLAELNTAVALYRADLLPECYDDWVLPGRERLREEYLWALEQLALRYKQWGDDEQALACAQRLVTADPLRETAHAELMRLYHALGRPRAALEQYVVLCQLLADELGVEPASATTALYRRIQESLKEASPVHLPAPAPPPALHGLSHLPFIGRTAERAALLEALQAAGRGHGGLALVEGPAGVGKTRLVEELVADARWRGFQVGLGRSDPLAASAPYGPLSDALAMLLTPLRAAQLAELVGPLWLSASAPLLPPLREHLPDLPLLGSLDPHQEQERLWEGLARCAAGLAAVTPLLLVVEDVHWADAATLAVLTYLAPRLPALRLLMILSFRSAEARERAIVWEALETMDRALPLHRVSVAPFPPEESAALVQRALGLEPADPQGQILIAALQRRTGNNALFLVETLKVILEHGAGAPASGDGWVPPDGIAPLPMPASLQELVGQRLLRLPSKLRATLELAAVLGEEARFTLLTRTTPSEAAELAGQLGDLCRRGFLAEISVGYRFEHEIVRDTVYRAISPRRRQALHGQAVAALESVQPENLEALAYHAAAGGDRSRAVRYYRKAGERAAAHFANREAVTRFSRALEYAPEDQVEERYALFLAREKAYDLLGDREAQQRDLEALRQAAVSLDEQCRAQSALRQANYAEVTSDFAAAVAAAREAAQLANCAQDILTEATARSQWGVALRRQGDYEGAQAQIEQALTLVRHAGQSQMEAAFLRQLGIVHWYWGNMTTAKDYYAQSLDIAHETGDRWNAGRALNNLGTVAWAQGDHTAARTYFEESLRLKRELGDRRGEGSTLGNLGTLLASTDNAAAAGYYEQALQIARDVGDRWEEGLLLNNLGICWLEQGEYGRALPCYEQALHIRQDVGDRHGVATTLGNLGEIYRLQGAYDRAQVYYEQSLTASQEISYRVGVCWARIYQSLLHHHQEDNQSAVRWAQEALDLATTIENQHLQARALINLGHAQVALGNLEEAVASYEQAYLLHLDAGEQGQSLDALAGLARAALRQGQIQKAHDHAEGILDFLGHPILQAAKEPLRTYLTCYQVLLAAKDPRAEKVLRDAHCSLQQQAARIPDPTLRRSFLENIAAHCEIAAAYEALQQQPQAESLQVRLSRIDAPTGRPLGDNEMIAVTWTLTAPGDDQIPGKAARRQHRLWRLLQEAAAQRAAPTVEDLAAALHVDARTIKRDLAALRAAGLPTPTRGRRSSA